MLKLKLGALLMAAALPFMANADGFRSIKVDVADGSTLMVNLTDGLKTKFTRNEIKFTDGADVNISLSKANVVHFTFVETSAIDAPETDTDATTPTVENRTLHFSNLPENSHIAIYDIKGRTTTRHEANGEFELNLEQLPAGVYVVNVNGISYKIALK